MKMEVNCCPRTRFNAKSYVTSGKETLAAYLRAVNEQTHPCYAKIAAEKFKCQCDLSLILSQRKTPVACISNVPKTVVNLFSESMNRPKA